MTDKNIQLKDGNNNNLFPATNYNDSINKPSIEGVPLIGNKTLEELGFSKIGKELLWTNPSPIATFPAQTITFDKNITNYDAFIVETHYANNNEGNNTTNIVLNDGIRHNIFCARDSTLSGQYFNYRGVTFDATSATFTNGAYIGSGTNYNQSHHCIPQKIYGVYFGVKIIGNDGRSSTKDLLWTNPSPTTTFAAQTVNLNKDASNYDAFLIETIYSSAPLGQSHSNIVLNDKTAHSLIAPRDSAASTPYYTIPWRSVTINTTTATFTQSIYVTSNTGAGDNQLCIPLSIYGINFGTKITNNYTYNLNTSATELTNLLYPIGSIYASTSSANPGSIVGGTWEQINDLVKTAWAPAGSIASNGTLCQLTLEAGTYIIGGYNASTSGALWLRVNDVFQDTNSNLYLRCNYNSGWSKVVTFPGDTTICYQNSNGSAITSQIGTQLYAVRIDASGSTINKWRRIS